MLHTLDRRVAVIAVVAATSVASVAPAASIGWTSSPFVNEGANHETMGTGQLDTSGTLLLADNTGGAATIYDGITYTSDHNFFGSTFAGAHASNSVSGTAGFGGSFGAGATIITLGSGSEGPLVVGKTYRIQLLVMDGRGDANDIVGRNVEVDLVNRGVFANGSPSGDWGNGLLITGTFEADFQTQVFSINAFRSAANGGTSFGGQINALLLHEVIPEPTSAALLLVGGALLGRRRRRGGMA